MTTYLILSGLLFVFVSMLFVAACIKMHTQFNKGNQTENKKEHTDA